MTPNGQIAIPLDKAAIREPFLTHSFSKADLGATAAKGNFVRTPAFGASGVAWE